MIGLLEAVMDTLTNGSPVVVDGTNWKGYIGYSPDDQHQIVSLYSTGGFPQDTLGGENVVETFQARVRAGVQDYAVCLAKWWEVFNALQDASIDDDVYLIQAMATGPMAFLDDRKRHNMTANFRVIRKRPL